MGDDHVEDIFEYFKEAESDDLEECIKSIKTRSSTNDNRENNKLKKKRTINKYSPFLLLNKKKCYTMLVDSL